MQYYYFNNFVSFLVARERSVDGSVIPRNQCDQMFKLKVAQCIPKFAQKVFRVYFT